MQVVPLFLMKKIIHLNTTVSTKIYFKSHVENFSGISLAFGQPVCIEFISFVLVLC